MVLSLGMLASALGMPATNGVMAVERPDVVFKVALVALSVLVVLVPALVVWWGLAGAAYGFLAGSMVSSVMRWAAFATLVPRSGPRAGALERSSGWLEPTVT